GRRYVLRDVRRGGLGAAPVGRVRRRGGGGGGVRIAQLSPAATLCSVTAISESKKRIAGVRVGVKCGDYEVVRCPWLEAGDRGCRRHHSGYCGTGSLIESRTG